MLPIKRLYTFIVQTFLPVFFMTFFICLFILLMQFLWRYVEDLVGKGLDNTVLFELFFYATLNLIPMALPLSILLASLMTFGNMGEQLELLAVKASGISLLKAMRPLIILVAAVSIGAFFFQNEAMPLINVKFKTLLSSIKHTSPELEIPEGSFYNGIKGYGLYVREKNPETRILHGMVIYNTSEGFNNMTVTVCDSAKMRVSDTKDFLLLNLYNGHRFANLKNGNIITGNKDSYDNRQNKFVPYYREQFIEETIIIPFEGNFDRMDESVMDGHQSAKNLTMLSKSMDSLSILIDSLNIDDRKMLKGTYLNYRNVDQYSSHYIPSLSYRSEEDSLQFLAITFDSVMTSFNRSTLEQVYYQASSDAERSSSSYMLQMSQKVDVQRSYRYHKIEFHQKFTLSFACLIFFFIGAPLGAIIRKGGLGMPVVISVLFFIVYYIFNNVGVKMARDGVWDAWAGMWLSSIILFPIGVFLTYKAMNDSDLFNIEAYGKYIRKVLKLRLKSFDNLEVDVDSKTVQNLSSLQADPTILLNLSEMDSNTLKNIAQNYKQYDYDDNMLQVILAILKERGDSFFGVKIKKLNHNDAKLFSDLYTKNGKRGTIIFAILLACWAVVKLSNILLPLIGESLNMPLLTDVLSWGSIAALVAYFVFITKANICHSDFYRAMDIDLKKVKFLSPITLYLLPIIFFPYWKKRMKKDMNSIKW